MKYYFVEIDKLYFVAKALLINSKNELLIVRRTDYKKDGSGGLWDIPGGSVEKNCDVVECIKRELIEELQYQTNNLNICYIKSGEGSKENSYGIYTLFTEKKDFDLVEFVLSHEHSEYKWVNYEEFCTLDFYMREPENLEFIQNYLKDLK